MHTLETTATTADELTVQPAIHPRERYAVTRHTHAHSCTRIHSHSYLCQGRGRRSFEGGRPLHGRAPALHVQRLDGLPPHKRRRRTPLQWSAARRRRLRLRCQRERLEATLGCSESAGVTRTEVARLHEALQLHTCRVANAAAHATCHRAQTRTVGPHTTTTTRTRQAAHLQTWGGTSKHEAARQHTRRYATVGKDTYQRISTASGLDRRGRAAPVAAPPRPFLPSLAPCMTQAARATRRTTAAGLTPRPPPTPAAATAPTSRCGCTPRT
jgi:hypothetical protein